MTLALSQSNFLNLTVIPPDNLAFFFFCCLLSLKEEACLGGRAAGISRKRMIIGLRGDTQGPF